MHLITNRPFEIEGVIIHDISPKTDTRPRYIRYRELGFNIGWVRKIKTIFTVRNLVRLINPDILHLHTLAFPAYLGLFIKYHPLVITFWNGDLLWKYQWSRLRPLMIAYGLKKADLLTVDSNAMLNNVLARGISPHKIKYISFGVDLEKFNRFADGSDIRSKLKIEDSPVIISPRSPADMYNIDVIIRSIPIVLSEIPEAKFLFIWPFNEEVLELKRLANELRVEKAIYFIGRVDHKDLPKYFNISPVVVSIPSTDSGSISLLEAMACEAVPVVGDVKGQEWIKNSWNGYLVPPRDPKAVAEAIIKILKNKLTRELFVKRNLELVNEKADHNKHMAKMEELYFSLLKTKKN